MSTQTHTQGCFIHGLFSYTHGAFGAFIRRDGCVFHIRAGLGRLQGRGNGGALEAEVGLEVLGDLTHKTLEGELVEGELGGLLDPTDLTESKSKSETCDLHTANNKEAASMQQL
jgi:hypothetical protein